MTGTVVIIVNFESGPRLRACVASVLSQSPRPREVVVVDNASRDDSTDSLPGDVTLIRNRRNEGFAAAVLVGMSASNQPLVLTLNPDTTLEPGCLQAAVKALESSPRTGCIALRVLRSDDRSRIDATGIGLTSQLGQINMDHGLRDDDVSRDTQRVLGPLGGAALWRRAAVVAAGHFDARYFLYWEDMDLALRMQRAGYDCRTAPGARILHEGSATVGRWSRLNVFYMVRNHWMCLTASLPTAILLRRWPALAVAPFRAALLYARRGRPLSACWGLFCGIFLVPRALWSRKHVASRVTEAAAARSVTTLMRRADENRLLMKSAQRGARDP